MSHLSEQTEDQEIMTALNVVVVILAHKRSTLSAFLVEELQPMGRNLCKK
jgi:hypothetical protein